MGPREQRSYSEDETDRSARTGGLGRPMDDDFDDFRNTLLRNMVEHIIENGGGRGRGRGRKGRRGAERGTQLNGAPFESFFGGGGVGKGGKNNRVKTSKNAGEETKKIQPAASCVASWRRLPPSSARNASRAPESLFSP